jgi:carboxyl-terminal processing protease
MKRKLFIIFFSVISDLVYGQIPVHPDSVYNFIKRTSIYKNSINWQDIDIGFARKLKLAKTDIDSIKSFTFVFEKIGDFHSSITYNGKQFPNYPEFDDSTLKYLLPLVNLSNQRMGVFEAKILIDNYLYLQVPGIQAWGDNVTVYAQKLSDTLCKYISTTIKGIVLDLRLNDGGQFASMASGLALLLGDRFIGGGINSETEQSISFSIQNKNLYINNNKMTSVIPGKNLDLSQLPVALLIGPNTRSSGSILAISFKGRKNTIFIGDSTASGYTTGNDYYSFGSNLVLNLSTAFSIDRNKKVYKSSVPPDIFIKGGDDFTDIEKDKKVNTALKWLKNNSR